MDDILVFGGFIMIPPWHELSPNLEGVGKGFFGAYEKLISSKILIDVHLRVIKVLFLWLLLKANLTCMPAWYFQWAKEVSSI